ncbi:hypothetical protein PHYBOEH_006138 [Phytophthora boehmeriae]|uniref:Uncharacterized protein n=1 Tax=Phytophthora boehmeriae TaxID=109152 RepID=A0A8T1WNP3_9STRA|nr:hypothetical protein PHYBOEH_006138 [Phytophthora boehmeriae]
MRHSRRWRHERGQDNDDEDEEDEEDFDTTEQQHGRQLHRMSNQQRIAQAANEVGNEDDEDDVVYPQHDESVLEHDQREVEEDSNDNDNVSKVQNDQVQNDAENAAATVIARGFQHHLVIVHREQERRKKRQRLDFAVSVAIQRWRARRARKLEQQKHETEKNSARLIWQRKNQAARRIQKWIRLRWASFWRRRRQTEREDQATKKLQQEKEQKELEESNRRQAELEEQRRQTELEEEQSRRVQEEEVRQRMLRQIEEEKQRHQLELEKEELKFRLQKPIEHEQVGDEVEGENNLAPSPSPQSQSPGKHHRKVMKKEAVNLIKTLVHQQLDETLRDHDAKMDELQRMVAKLQTVVRKQTAMIKDSTDQLVNFRTAHQEKQPVAPPRNNHVTNDSFLPQIQSSIPRQPVAPSGIRAPRSVMASKLPLLRNSTMKRK